MSEINWIDIIKLKEFKDIFNTTEFIQLSMVCKRFRICLFSVIFKIFDFGTFIRYNNYKSCIISKGTELNEKDAHSFVYTSKSLRNEFTESMNRFKLDLELYHYNINSLILNNVIDHYYLIYKIPSIFYNVRTLDIQGSDIIYDVLQYLIDNLAFLEDIVLIANRIYKRKQDINFNSVDWPIGLKKLETGLNLIGYVDEREHNIILRPGIEYNGDFSALQLLPINLPNLVLLDYMPSLYDNDDINELFGFLKANQNIKKLYIRNGDFNPMIFNLIKSLENLTHLDLSDLESYSIINIELIDTLVQSKLKYLDISLYEDNGFLHTLTEQFPNLTHLTLRSIEMKFNELCSYISKFHKLKTLKLQDYSYLGDTNELDLQNLNNLESFELLSGATYNFKNIKWSVNSCPKLRLVKFTTYHYFNICDIPKLSSVLESSWKLVYFPIKLSFYRIN